MKYVVVIPAYDPDDKLVKLVAELKGTAPIVVVDDGSMIGKNFFTQIADSVDILLRHDVNRGKGAALKTAFRYVYHHYPDADGVVTADSDGQHAPKDIARVAQAMRECPDGITLGVRKFSGEVPWRSRFGNSCTRLLFRLMTGMAVADTQTGLRGIPRVLLPRMLEISGDRYEYEMRMLADCKLHGARPVQVEIETIYIEGNRSSHFNPLKDSIRVWGALFHFCFSSVGAFLIDNVLFYMMLFVTQHISFGLSVDVLISLIVARFFSANFQYFYNRHITFQSEGGMCSYFKYWCLVGLIAVLSFMGVNGLVRGLGIEHRFGVTLLKIVVETVLFVLSYWFQRAWVFGGRVK